jgi:hypothetical protein
MLLVGRAIVCMLLLALMLLHLLTLFQALRCAAYTIPKTQSQAFSNSTSLQMFFGFITQRTVSKAVAIYDFLHVHTEPWMT